MSRMTTGPTTTASPSGASRIHDIKRKHEFGHSAVVIDNLHADVEGAGVLESMLGQTLDARQPHVVANPPNVVEVKDIAGRIPGVEASRSKAARVSWKASPCSTIAPFSLTPATEEVGNLHHMAGRLGQPRTIANGDVNGPDAGCRAER